METDNHLGAPRALVLAMQDWPLTAYLAINLRRSGFTVEGLCPRRHALRHTSSVDRCFLFSGARPVRSLLRAIRRSSPAILVPGDDQSLYAIYDLHEQCSRDGGPGSVEIIRLIERSLGDPAAFSIARSKAALIRLARENAIRIPETRELSNVDELAAHCETTAPPFVLKQDGTYGGLGVIVTQSKDEAKRAFRRLRTRTVIGAGRQLLFKANLRPLIMAITSPAPVISAQQYIEGRPANRAVLCWRGRVLAGATVMTLEAAPFPNGPATVVEFIREPEIDRAVDTLVSNLALSGFCGFDFMLDRQTGRPFLLELNPRATSAAWLGSKPGSDLCAALFRALDAEQRSTVAPSRSEDEDPPGEKVALFPQEWLRSETSVHLSAAYHRVPWHDRKLVRYLIRSATPHHRKAKAGLLDSFTRRIVLGSNWKLSSDSKRAACGETRESRITE